MQVDLIQPSGLVTPQAGNGNVALVQFQNVFPGAAVPILASSGNVANAVAAATLSAAAAKTTYISGFEITGGGATAASLVLATITGLLGGTATYTVAAVAGAALGNVPLMVELNPALPASAVNTAIVVSVPALGAGNTNSCVVAHGFQV